MYQVPHKPNKSISLRMGFHRYSRSIHKSFFLSAKDVDIYFAHLSYLLILTAIMQESCLVMVGLRYVDTRLSSVARITILAGDWRGTMATSQCTDRVYYASCFDMYTLHTQLRTDLGY